MSIFSKIFGKKRTVDTQNPHAHQHHQQQAAVQNAQNAQANQYAGFEIVNNVIPDGTPVVDVFLNVDTESKSRSHMSLGELWDSNVGHTWLTIRPLNGQLPDDLTNQIQPVSRSLIEAHGETAVGFWPITVRHDATEGKKLSDEEAEENAASNATIKAEMNARLAKGYTAGSGSITKEEAPNYDLHSTMIGKDTAGRVEEPDDAHTPKGRKVYRLTRKQFRNMYRYIDAHRTHNYNLYTYNCTTFAAHALRAAGQNVPMEGMTMPTSLYEAMYKEAKAYEKNAERARRRHQQIAPSSVQLLKLGKGEAHRQKGKDKEGPNGRNVRVKGVERFDMPLFSDPAEVSLRRVVELGEVTKEDKQVFTQSLFKDTQGRTREAVRELTQEAVNVGLISGADREEFVNFYEQGYNLIRDPRTMTSPPALYSDYILKIVNSMPSTEAVKALLNGKEISPEFDMNKLNQRALWHVFNCGKTGDEFALYTEPLLEIVMSEAMTPSMLEAFRLCLEHSKNKLSRDDLKRVQHLTSVTFNKAEQVRDMVYDYYKTYFNYRIKNHIMTAEDAADAREFGTATEIPKVLGSYAKIDHGLNVSRKWGFFATLGEKNGNQINAIPQKYIKAQKPANAPKPDENEVIAEAYLNVDTTNIDENHPEVSRSKLTGDVGHTWLTLKAMPKNGEQQGSLPADIEAAIQKTDTGRNTVNIIRAKGETAMGFYPLKHRFEDTQSPDFQRKSAADQQAAIQKNIDEQAKQDVRRYKGFTAGSGSVTRGQTQYYGFNPLKSVQGRVEEPDDSHTPKGRKRFTLTRKQFKKIYKYIEAHRNHKYNLESYNCTTFATHALRDAGYSPSGSRMGICYPARMYRELYDEAKRDARNHRQGDVQLLKLADHESHGEYRPGKIGENGVDVRVPGVDSFDMVTDYTDYAEHLIRKFKIDNANASKYQREFIASMIQDLGKRSLQDSMRFINEAVRLSFIKNEEAQKLSHLCTAFHNLDKPLENYVNLSYADQYDFLSTIRSLIDANTFRETFQNGIRQAAGKLLTLQLGTPEFIAVNNIVSELGKGLALEDQIDASLDNLEPSVDLAKTCITVNSSMLCLDSGRLKDFIVKTQHGSPELAFNFLLDMYEDDQTTDEIRSVLEGQIQRLIPDLPFKDAFNVRLQELNASGKLPNAQYQFIKTLLSQEP